MLYRLHIYLYGLPQSSQSRGTYPTDPYASSEREFVPLVCCEGISIFSIISELKDAFDLFDKTGDKKIDVNELGMVLRSLGQNPTDGQVEEVMKKADKDGNFETSTHNLCFRAKIRKILHTAVNRSLTILLKL